MALTVDSTGTPVKATGTTSADQLILKAPMYIKFIHWFNPTAAGHLLALQDESGRNIAEIRCESANRSEWAPIWTPFNEVRCDNMDSGTLYIYIS